MRGIVVVAAFLTLVGGAHSAPRRLLRVSADASLKESAEAIAKQFRHVDPSVDVRFQFRGSGQIAKDLRAGEPIDVFLSAGPRPMREIGAHVGRPRIFARNILALIVPPTSTDIKGLADLVEPERILVPNLEDPAFVYARTMLDRAAQAYGRGWLSLVERHLVPDASDTRAAVAAVASGDSPVAIAYATDAIGVSGVKAVAIAPGLNPVASYSAAAVLKSSHRPLADRFVEFLLSDGAQKELVRRGFTSPFTAPPELSVYMGGETLRLFVNNLRALPQKVMDVEGHRYRGADLRAIVAHAEGTRVRLTGADGMSVDVSLVSLRKLGGVLVPMGGSNLQAVLPGQPSSRWVRWIRRIEVL